MRSARHTRRDGADLLVDAMIGAAAGAAAVWAMDRVDWLAYRNEDARARARTQAVRPGGMDPAHTAVSKAADAMGGEAPSPRQHNAAGTAMHYAIGVVPAALYGMLRHHVPGLDTGRGTLFGLALFFLQDEGLNALTGLSAGPRAYPWQAHARGFMGHAIFGVVLDTVLGMADGMRSTARGPAGPGARLRPGRNMDGHAVRQAPARQGFT